MYERIFLCFQYSPNGKRIFLTGALPNVRSKTQAPLGKKEQQYNCIGTFLKDQYHLTLLRMV